ncbi:glycerophosphodiester phosphodiesterase family protein [Paractinoplanes hotanensis]|uniref:Carbohydrate-binding protein n=1 Tax=Paractinoplanes hotanensis TaxID=2906497 RepID=A0ABT0Y8U6_9ACTN|nr:glycerophosphodiester phosphodiesterase family protein [Actinoplanes hotanensis]MCM4082467.1 carbohydrate-binding protein [Actinoplanes hotanensis]
MRVPIIAAVTLVALAGAVLPLRETEALPLPAAVPLRAVEKPGSLFLRHGTGAPVMVVAHRGYWRGAPENSLGAVTQAVSHGAQVVEVDIRRTRDGELVLMHDDSVDRTTDGRGRVADLTLAEVRALRLREGLGGRYAPVTAVGVPTLREALLALRDSGALVNLDRGWAYRDQIYDLLVELGQVEQGIFKSGAPIDEVTAFLDRDPRILYNHVVGDANAVDIGAFPPGRPPQAYELVFDRLTDAQIQPAAVARAKATSRVWVSTMWYGMAAGYTDEASLRDPALGWATLIERHGADIIQTDDPDDLSAWLSARDLGHPWPPQPAGTVRVQAEDYSPAGKGLGYYDLDDINRGGAARPFEGVDVGDTAGAIVVGWIRAGEWIRYDVAIPRSGNYRVSARVASPYRPAGRFTLTFDGARTTPPVEVMTTTSHYAFASQVVIPSWHLTEGAHTVVLRADADRYQNFNLDHLEFTPLD